jgi:plasmid stability protein
METLTIRIEEPVGSRLRMQADRHGCSMEEEVKRILKKSLAAQPGIGTRIQQRFQEIGGVDLNIPSRSLPRLAGLQQDSDAP